MGEHELFAGRCASDTIVRSVIGTFIGTENYPIAHALHGKGFNVVYGVHFLQALCWASDLMHAHTLLSALSLPSLVACSLLQACEFVRRPCDRHEHLNSCPSQHWWPCWCCPFFRVYCLLAVTLLNAPTPYIMRT